jgi:hypothetical protein
MFVSPPNRKEPAITDTPSETPALDTLAAMTAESVVRCGLDELCGRVATERALEASTGRRAALL